MCDFSPLSAKDKSTSQTPAECVTVFHILANAKKKKKLTDLSMPLACLYISVSCFMSGSMPKSHHLYNQTCSLGVYTT